MIELSAHLSFLILKRKKKKKKHKKHFFTEFLVIIKINAAK